MWSCDFGISGPQLFHNVFLCCARSKCIFEVVVFVSLTFYDVCHCCMSTTTTSPASTATTTPITSTTKILLLPVKVYVIVSW